MEITKFDKTKDYEDIVKLKIQELKRACNEAKMPMFVTVCTKSTNGSSVYVQDMVGTFVNNICLKNDVFPKLVNVMNGFDTVPHQEPIEIEY